MKMLLLCAVVLVVCVVLFVTGVISPHRSKRMQSKVARTARKGEKKGERNGGRMGDKTSEGLKKMRRATDASAESGREVRSRMEKG